MYKEFYNLKENPFQIDPDPRYLYLSPKHENALAYLRYGLKQKSAFTLLTGEIGTGKTTVTLYFLIKYCRDIKTAFVSNTNVAPDQLLNLILRNFKIRPHEADKSKNLELLHLVLSENFFKKIPCLLILDEAQNLSAESLEEIRMLSNFQRDGHLLLQIMLVGQPELRARLKNPNLANVSQKISASYHLTALSYQETWLYMAYRLNKAGGSHHLFSREAKDLIYKKSAGIPRTINLLCDAALVYGFAEELQTINAKAVENAIKDKDSLGLDYSSDYANAILSAPLMQDKNENELINRIQAIEKNLKNLQKQVELSSQEVEQRLNDFKHDFAGKLKKIILYERKRTGKLIKIYFQELNKLSASAKTLLKDEKLKDISIKQNEDYNI
jgi:general secretion pathway protein A